MGDLLLKQKPPRPHWQSAEMLPRKPFPPIYQNHRLPQRNSFNFPHNPIRWREGGFYPAPVFNFPPPKAKDHYFLAPYYRNVMPPPPNPNRLLMVDPRKRGVEGRRATLNGGGLGRSPSCQCRSKSMEDVRTEVVEVAGDRWQDDVNGNRVPPPMKNGSKFGRYSNRRSMENLLVDTSYSPPGRRTVRSQVGNLYK